MTAEDFLNQYDPSNKEVASQEPASSAKSFLDQYDPSINLKPSGTSFGEEVSQLGSAFVESIGRPLENMGESFESFGFSGVANALKGAITEPENYVSAGQRFMEPAPDEAQLMGFAWQYAPRAAVEQVGQAIGAIGTRAVGAAAGGAVAGPPGAIAGGFLGPAVFGAAQVIGPVAKERAMNNGREVPNNEDLVAATLTAIGSGSLDAIGAQFLPGGKKAAPKFFKRVASAFAGEGLLTEAPQSVIEQIGATAGTEKGLNINVKQAVGEGLIGGTSAAGLTAIVSPFSKPVENQVIRTPEQAEELDIDSKANQEAILLMGDPADQTQNERVTKLKEIESVIANNETLMTGLEPNAPERSKLDLENRVAKKEAERLKLEITQGAGLSETITTIEEQQAALAKTITSPTTPTVKESLTVQPTQAALVTAPVEQVVTPTVEVAPLPARTVEESIQNKDTFEFEGMRGAVSLEDGATVFRPFGTNDKYEVPINPNQSISEIEGIQWVRKGQTRQTPVEPTIPEITAIVESQPQITEEEFNATEDDFQLPQSLIEIEKSPTLNAIADIFNTGESKIAQEGKRAKKVSATPEFYRQISPEQVDVANKQIDNALRIIDNLPVSEEQKQTLAEPYLLIDQDISSYENNPEYKQYKASIRREVRPAGEVVTLTETISEVAAGVKELEQRQGITKPAPAITPASVAEAPAVTEAPAAEPAGKIAKIKQRYSELLNSAKNTKERSSRLESIWNEQSSLDPNEREAAKQFFAEKLNIPKEQRRSELGMANPMQISGAQKASESGNSLDLIRNNYGDISDMINRIIDMNPKIGEALKQIKVLKENKNSFDGETIRINKATQGPDLVEAINHEIVHGFLAVALREIPSFREAIDKIRKETIERSKYSKDKTFRIAVEFLKDVYGQAKSPLAKKRDSESYSQYMARKGNWLINIWNNSLAGRQEPMSYQAYETAYALISNDEFLTHALTSPRFRDELKALKIETPDTRNLFQKFIDAIRNLFQKLTKVDKNILDKVMEQVEYVVQLPEYNPRPIEGLGDMLAKTDREEIMGEKIGPLKTTPEGIIAKTQELLRKKFDPAKVSEQNTTEAFRALGRLIGRGGTDFAKELNDVGRVVDESGAASEISMGAALFINDLFEYSIRLAAEGNKKLLGIMLTNINKLPTAGIGVSDAARDLRARLELAQRFLTMAQAEQDAYTNYVAEFIYGPNPTKDQIQSIKDAYVAVEKTQQVTEQELTDEIKVVGDRSGTDLVGKINEEFTKATEKGKEKRKTEEEEFDIEYKKIQRQADAEIEKLAKIQSDTPSFDPAAARQITNDVRAIVANDLKQRPDMGRKAPWKSLLVAKLQEAGVELAAAETLADIVWRQHEINSLSRELSSIDKAIEKGPISEIVKAIKDTPLEDQQNPNWRYEVMRDYLRKAGLPTAQAERIAKLMDISLQKRFTMAQEQAFTDAISKTAPWKAGDTRSRRAFQKVLQALRAGALDPARNVLSDMAALNGWTGFSPEQYKTLLKNDAILADPKSGELKKAEAYKAIQDVISKAKLPIRARDVIGQYYDAQALSGIPTFSVNAFSPIAFALRNAIVEIGSGTLKGNPKAITNAATALVDSIKSWANTVAFSFKNNVTVYSNVDYIVNDDNLLRLYRKGVDQFNKGKTPRDKADGVKNMMVGMMDYVRRILNALDYGAIASLQNQNISKYAMAVMKRQGMSTKEGNEMFAVMMKAKNDFYLQQIAIGTDKNKASILADEFYISSWSEALTKAGVEKSDIKQAMDAAINDALSSVGRNRQSIDALKGEATKLKDAGVSSMPALWLLESMANAANQSDNQILKLFSRVIYGFAIVPARVIRETAWFSPYGFVRFGYDAIAKRMGKTSPYAQSLGTDVQYSQRLNEAIAGTVALTALFALRAGSTDEPEEDDFKIVFTGNGPQRKDDPQFYDSWYKAGNKPNTMSVSFGKGKFDLNMMRGFEAFTWPAMMLGALDDLEIRKKQKQQTKTPTGIEDASIVAGFVFDAALRRGPYAFTTKSLFGTYGDIGVEGVAKGLTFPAKTLIPVLGTSLASNLSNFLNDPIDRRTLDGAVWSNIPFIGPAVAPKSLNAFGEPALSTDFASKMFKLGVPIVYDIPTDRESIKLHELVLKQGGGPSIPTRNQLAQRLDRQPTNKEYEMFVKEYGTVLTASMKKNYDKLFNAKPEFYSKAVEKIGLRARNVAENKVKQATKKP